LCDDLLVATVEEIAPATTVGAVELTVSDLDRSLDYYSTSIGLDVLQRAGGCASLGAGDVELLVLVEERGAAPADGYTGLFHFALLVPTRVDLARWLAHAARDRVALTGLSDHAVSEALYLRDPDHHGIEIYADRPRMQWEGKAGELLTTRLLDTDSLLGELEDPASEPFDGLPPGTVMGHIHLRVASIPETVEFFRDVLGFGLIAQLRDQAAFLSAGGYHHHVGANTWESAGAPPAPVGTASLRHATIVLPDADERASVVARVERGGLPIRDLDGVPAVSDPAGNTLVLATAS